MSDKQTDCYYAGGGLVGEANQKALNGKRECPHCHGSLAQYEDPEAVNIIGRLEADLYERLQWLNNAERILRGLGYERCTAAACNCSSYHKRESSNG